MCADTAVDDDATTLGLLLLHISEGFSSAEVGCSQIDVNRGLPVRQLLLGKRHVWRRNTGVAEDEVNTAKFVGGLLEDTKDNVFLGNITDDVVAGAGAAGSVVEKRDSLLKLVLSAASDGDVPASACEGNCACSAKLC